MSEVVKSVLAEVAEHIKNSNTAVKDRVVAALVEAELVKRVATLDKALAKASELGRGLRKYKPDVENFAADGTASATYSKKLWEEKKASEENLARLEKAIEAALDGGEFGKLGEMLAKIAGADKSAEK